MVTRVKELALLVGLIAAVLLVVSLASGQPGAAHPPLPQGADGPVACATCHGPGADPKVVPAGASVPTPPADHAAYKPDSCVTCHATVAKSSPTVASYAACATCHGKTDGQATLKSGETLSTFIDIPKYTSSVHGNFSCTECHKSQSTIPHVALTADGRRAFTQEMSTKICQSCHKDATESYADSFHGVAARLGVAKAANCTDCHTPHAVKAPATWTLEERAAQCAACHKGATPSFASGWLGHKEPSLGWFPAVFFAEKFFVVLTALTLGVGIVHVELELFRWTWNKARGRKEEEADE